MFLLAMRQEQDCKSLDRTGKASLSMLAALSVWHQVSSNGLHYDWVCRQVNNFRFLPCLHIVPESHTEGTKRPYLASVPFVISTILGFVEPGL